MPNTEPIIQPSSEPSAICKFWRAEIRASRKREKDWRKDGARILRIYEAEKAENSDDVTKAEAVPYNILYSNTETMHPALYSATPRPIVQRRYKDDDALGKAAATAGQRMLEFLIDTNMEGYESFDDVAGNATLDALLPGRAVSRIKFDADVQETPSKEDGGQPDVYTKSELVCGETISWDRVLFGFARRWSKVPWVAFEHHIDKKEATRICGEKIADELPYTTNEETDREKDQPKDDDANDQGERKTTRIYEIWDKVERTDGAKKVRYFSEHYPDGVLKVEDDPLGLTGFFPIPKPLQFVNKSNSRIPTALYTLYENQAKEVNKISRRISHLIEAMKVRGIYDGELGETLQTLFESTENQLIPTDKTATLANQQGLEKSIWMQPVDKHIVVLTQLYQAREAAKHVIYEITGIADIIRGSSVASETLGAQQIKERWGTMRLKRLQREVQRYVRDMLRIMLEIAATKFSEDTWAKMTGLKYLSQMQEQQLTAIAKQGDKQAAQTLASTPPWSKVLGLLKNDIQRSYRVDIETNSTVEPEAAEDQKNINELMTALGQYLNGVAPLVAKGVMDFKVAQAMMLVIVRRYRFGTEIEEYIKQMQPPKPENDGGKVQAEQAKAQMQMQLEQMKAQMQQQTEQAKLQSTQASESATLQLEREKLALEAQTEAAKLQWEKEREAMRLAAERELKLLELQNIRTVEKMKAQFAQETALKTAAMKPAPSEAA